MKIPKTYNKQFEAGYLAGREDTFELIINELKDKISSMYRNGEIFEYIPTTIINKLENLKNE